MIWALSQLDFLHPFRVGCRMAGEETVKWENDVLRCWWIWLEEESFAHSVFVAIELLSLLSRPPKKPLTSVLDVFLRRRSAASFFPDSQELALFRYESRATGGPPRSSSSEGDSWHFPEHDEHFRMITIDLYILKPYKRNVKQSCLLFFVVLFAIYLVLGITDWSGW